MGGLESPRWSVATEQASWVFFPPPICVFGGLGRQLSMKGRGAHIQARVQVLAPGVAQPPGMGSVGQGGRSPTPRPAESLPGQSVDPLHPLVVGVKGRLEVGLGSVGHPHPLQGIVPALHEVQGDLVGTEEGPRSLGALREPG